jgi:hypothetical protein
MNIVDDANVYVFECEMENDGLNYGFEISTDEEGVEIIGCMWFATEEKRNQKMASFK